MRERKKLRYYLYIYLLSLGGLFVYLLFIGLTNNGFDRSAIPSLLWVPIFVTLFVFLIDKLTGAFTKKKGHSKKQAEDEYIDYMTTIIDKNHDLLVEDYRKLKESDRFQRGLAQAYHILEHGEDTDISFEFILKKYPKQSLEYDVMSTVIEETKILREKRNKLDTK